MKIIGLTGAKGSGKSTVAQMLHSQMNYHTESMAQPIRDMLLALGIKRRQLHEDKEEVIPAFGFTGRYLLQTLGTEWGRGVDPDIWVNAMKLKVESSPWDICIDDIRFPNEANMIHYFGGKLIYIKRATAEGGVDTHESEAHYKTLPYDEVIVNNGDIGDLHNKIMKVIKG